jgi:phage major head subunit gpT-like protein
MGLLSESTLDDLDTQVVASVYQGNESVETWMGAVAETVPSSTKDVTYAHLVNPSKPRKWRKGTPKVFQSIKRGSRKVTNDRYEMSVNADRDELDDDTTGLYRKELVDAAFENGQKYAQVKDEIAGLVLTENMTCMDKAPLFGTHRVNPLDESSATYVNAFTGMPFTPDNVAKAMSIIMALRGPDGLPRKLRPSHAVLPPSLMVRGDRIFGAGQVNGTDNVLKGKVSQIIAPELGDDGSHGIYDETWYLAILTGRKRPLVYQTREALKALALFDPRDPNVWERNELIWTSSERFAIAGGYPYTIFRFRP